MKEWTVLLQNKILRNLIVAGLVFLFGFSQVLEIFREKTVQAGPFKLKISDIAALGGFRPDANRRSYQIAFYKLVQLEALSREADKVGLVVTQEDITRYMQDNFKNEDNEFDPEAMEDFLKKEYLSKEGLLKAVRLELLTRQLVGTIKLGMGTPDAFVQKFVRAVNTKTNGYYATLDTQQLDVKRYGVPSQEDLFEFLSNTPELIDNQTCEVFSVGHGNADYTIDELRSGFEAVTYPIQQGEICASCKMNISNLEVDSNTYLSQRYLNSDGQYVQIQFKPLFGMNQNDVEKAWYSSELAKVKACQTLIGLIKNQLQGNPDAIKSRNLFGIRFEYIEGVTFKECFQAQEKCSECGDGEKCDACTASGCICKECFNANNKFKLSRAVAIMMLFGKKKQLHTYAGEAGHHLVFPMDELEGEVTNEEVSKVSEEIKLQVAEGAAKILVNEILYKQLIVI
jgi:hypothetical protein